MVNKQILLALLVSSTLVACGSSVTVNSSSGSNNPGSPNPGSTSKIRAAKVLTKASTGKRKSHGIPLTATTVNQLVIDGKTITLMPVGLTSTHGFVNVMNSQTGYNNDNLPRMVSGTGYQSKFGLVKNGDELTSFSQGHVSNKNAVPTTGNATYKGIYAAYNHDAADGMKAVAGDFTGKVDFANKKINILAAPSDFGFPGFEIDGKIDGNHFFGKKGTTVITHGQFYGDNAEELGGVYSNDGFDNHHYSAAFGGKKQ